MLLQRGTMPFLPNASEVASYQFLCEYHLHQLPAPTL